MRLSPALPMACLVAGALALAGCSSESFLGRRMDNFKAYYNTYYNAERELEAGERALRREDEPVDRTRFISLFTAAQGASGSGREGPFDKAIKKGADLLREHPDSKWVDEALLVIGKAYFYQSNFVGAEAKFREVLALEEGGARRAEATLWLGRTLVAARQYEEAAAVLAEGIAREDTPRRFRGAMQVAQGEGFVREGRMEEAAAALSEGLGSLSGDLGGRAAFLLGQVLDELDRPLEAAEAYARVLRYKPVYPLAYAAQLNGALALGLGGEPEAGLDLLRRLSSDDKYFDRRAEIALARARVLAAAGRPAEAVALGRSLLYNDDPTLRIGDIRGELHYRLGEFYRDGLQDYRRAAAHFDTSAVSLRAPAVTGEPLTQAAIEDAARQAGAFSSFDRVAAEVAEADSLLYLGALPEDEFQAAIAEIRAQRRREVERQLELERRQREAAGFSGSTGFDDRGVRRGDEAATGATAAAGFLDFRNPVRVQEALAQFQFTWGDRPLVPGWRRAEAVAGAVAMQEAVSDDFAAIGGGGTSGIAGVYIDLSPIPRDPEARDRVRAQRAAARYEVGNALFFGIGRPDSAAVWYRMVIEEDGDLPVAARAYYALAETRRALGAEAEAQGLYQALLEYYPDSDVAAQARRRLNPSAEVAAVGASTGEADYREAYARWQRGRYAQAVEDFLRLGADTTAAPTAAARALLAAGAAYAEWALRDSLDLAEPLPEDLVPPSLVPAAAPEPAPAADSLAADPPAGDDVAADSLAMDSLAVAADTSTVTPEAVEPMTAEPTEPEAPLAVEPPRLTLAGLYALIQERHPGTPFATRAEALRRALAERQPEAVADVAPAAAEPVPAGTWGLRGGPLVADSSGVTWLVGSGLSPADAAALVADLQGQGLRAEAYGQGDQQMVVVGQFPTEAEGVAVRAELPPELLDAASLLPVEFLGPRAAPFVPDADEGSAGEEGAEAEEPAGEGDPPADAEPEPEPAAEPEDTPPPPPPSDD